MSIRDRLRVPDFLKRDYRAFFAPRLAFFRSKRGIRLLVLSALAAWYWLCLPDPLFSDPTSTVLLDKKGELLGAKIAGDGQWRFPLNDTVPEKFTQCIVQYEDRQFYRHPGINPFSLFRAMKQNASSGEVVSGGSTLTMQTIRIARNNPPRNLWQKIIEMILATRIELSYSKNEILSLYASNAPFGSNVVGLDAAAWRYFGRRPHQLSWAESATLAVLPNSPSLIYPGKNQLRLKKKRDRLLDRLREAGIIDQSTCELSKEEPLPGKPFPLPRLAPHLLERTSKEGHKGQIVHSTVDGYLQERVNYIIEKHHRSLKANEVHNAAALVLDVETGNVLAYVGNTDAGDMHDHGSEVDVINAPRSTGSILKPYLYCAMLNDGELLPSSLVPDIPTDISGYSPQNFNRGFDGAVPAKRALARSLNVPCVRMLQSYRTERFHDLLKKIGMTTINQPPDHYGLSLILGGAEGKLWDLAGVYGSMARSLNRYNRHAYYLKSDYHPATYIAAESRDTTPTGEAGYYDAASIWLTFEAMVEVARPDEESGWAEFTSSNRIAWKTGTSFGYRDGWAIGVTPKYVVAVWVGNANGEGRPGLTGIGAAAPVLFDIFNLLKSPSWFKRPDAEMRKIEVCKQSGHRALDICEKEWQYVPKAGLKTAPCPYHRMIHLDATGQYRVTSDCEDVSRMQHKPWFILPPSMEYYYKSKNPAYSALPPFRDDCIPNSNTVAMEFVYPRESTKIFVPVELDGKPGRTVFEIAHRKSNTMVYWHMDEQYLGSTQGIHQMGLNPEPGIHTITVVDENGETLTREIEILGKEN
ncbi:MAG: penicillin-binding protein 1C [Bacteroidetes bacterium]|nr:MAG: penicillin-binding protein 1C [Bacteroidota bacterium]